MNTKKITIKLLFIFSFIPLIFSCEDNRMNDITEDKVYLIKSGVQNAQLFNFGTYKYELIVNKSGIGRKEAKLKLTIANDLLESYNTAENSQYEILPANCFTFENKELNIAEKEASDKFCILFNTTAIQKLSSQKKSFALPIRIEAVNDIELLADNSNVLLIPVLSEPYIEFTEPGLSKTPISLSLNDPESFNVPVSIQTNYKPQAKLNFKIEVDTQELTKYNDANNTNYLLLPENSYQLFPNEHFLNVGQKSKDLNISIVRKNLLNKPDLYLFGEYILPLRIKEVSEHTIAQQGATILLHISCSAYELSRTTWEIIEWNSCICEEPKYIDLNRTPEKLLDNDISTFWGSKWDVPKPMPYYFVIDMKASKNIVKIGLRKPDNIYRGNQKKGYFEISDDLNTWKKIGDWQITNNGARSHVFEVTPSHGRYLRFIITEAFSYANNNVGPTSGAQMDLSELYVWGVD
ncbi:BT_3987 domain-containing protein [Sunxiuqinia elliptica]|uniref:F5/8 type C domain-containing protein n=1 Tax=Sunxiuqinia elliptica TaxID=655355 RepID=A0A4V3BX12_9BACT|nr:DUF1735 domain-containing protein [Sunxiuqinia elliptica]TDN97088.1 F5/8 type C domain-containing protein [Sunxiuqinia elliptica]TDO60727.1 F5/8 type C domain-containing protein [Sunxiuqinia elliptica]